MNKDQIKNGEVRVSLSIKKSIWVNCPLDTVIRRVP